MKKAIVIFIFCVVFIELQAQKIINIAIPPATIQWQYSVLNTGKYGIKNTSVLGLEPFFVEVLNIGHWGFQASISNQTFNTALKGANFLLNDAINLVDGEIIKVGPFDTDVYSKSHIYKFGKEPNVQVNFTIVRAIAISKLTLIYGLGGNLRLFDNYKTNSLNIFTNDTAISKYYYNFRRDMARIGFNGKIGCNINLSEHFILTGNVVLNAYRIARQDVYFYYKKDNNNMVLLKYYDTNYTGFSFALGGQLLLKYSIEYKKRVTKNSINEKTKKFLFGY